VGRSAAWAVVGALLLAAGTPTAIAQAPASACGARGDVADLIACLKSAYERTDAAGQQDCERRPPALVRPVEGRRVLRFGDRTINGSRSDGTTIESARGTPVSAPAAGIVLFAGEWRSYGTLVIIGAGCGTHVVLAGVGALTVAVGDQVERGERIGSVPAPPTPADLPAIYFEVRRNGAPVDPVEKPQ